MVPSTAMAAALCLFLGGDPEAAHVLVQLVARYRAGEKKNWRSPDKLAFELHMQYLGGESRMAW